MHPRGFAIPRTAGVADPLQAMQNVQLGPVHLTVTDLARSVDFYQDAIGLQVHGQDAGEARMGAGGEDLLVLHEDAQARPAGRHAGLYHVAYLFDSREELAHAVLRLTATRTRIDGASDHGVSEAFYLPDPDGNGIELYADRPRADWPEGEGDERIGMFTAPLDVDDLLASVEGQELRRQAGPGLVVGHVHLHVGDLDRAMGFYGDVLGFDLMARYPGARFLGADGYHHHLGVNTWRGEGAPPAPAHSVGLRRWTLRVGDLDQVRERLVAAGIAATEEDGAVVTADPWGTGISLSSLN